MGSHYVCSLKRLQFTLHFISIQGILQTPIRQHLVTQPDAPAAHISSWLQLAWEFHLLREVYEVDESVIVHYPEELYSPMIRPVTLVMVQDVEGDEHGEETEEEQRMQ